MKKNSKCIVHMIGHAHIDPTWLWRWTEGYEEVRSTFRSALDRMNETPEFKFTASSACFYRWVKTVDPQLSRKAAGKLPGGSGWNPTATSPVANRLSGMGSIRNGFSCVSSASAHGWDSIRTASGTRGHCPKF